VLKRKFTGCSKSNYPQFEQKVTLEARFKILAADVLKVKSAGLYLCVEWQIVTEVSTVYGTFIVMIKLTK